MFFHELEPWNSINRGCTTVSPNPAKQLSSFRIGPSTESSAHQLTVYSFWFHTCKFVVETRWTHLYNLCQNPATIYYHGIPDNAEMFKVPNMADFLDLLWFSTDMPFAVQDLCSHFEPTCVSHKLPYNMNDFPWYYQPSLIWSFFLTSISFVTPLNQTSRAAQHQYRSYSKLSAGALGYRVDQASKQCPSTESHLLISVGGFCPDPRRGHGSGTEVQSVTAGVSSGVPFGWQAFVLQGTWHFFSKDERKYFYHFLPPNFVSQQFWLFNSETTGISYQF